MRPIFFLRESSEDMFLHPLAPPQLPHSSPEKIAARGARSVFNRRSSSSSPVVTALCSALPPTVLGGVLSLSGRVVETRTILK